MTILLHDNLATQQYCCRDGPDNLMSDDPNPDTHVWITLIRQVLHDNNLATRQQSEGVNALLLIASLSAVYWYASQTALDVFF